MTTKKFSTTAMAKASAMLILSSALIAGCASMDSEESLVEYATADFGAGPQEIAYEEVDGMAVFQGDMILGPIEWVRDGNFKLAKPPAPDEPVAAAGLSHMNAWPNGRIPFRIDSSDFPTGSTMRARIDAAIAHWNQNTLVQLVPASGSEHHVLFKGKNGVCRSSIGYQPLFGPQLIELDMTPLDRSTCSTGGIIHEIGHTVGFFHEQTRADRDNHIVVNWDNIVSGKEHNFDTYVVSGFVGLDFGTYDRGSIMHYGSFDFAADSSVPTIVRSGCDPNAQNLSPSCLISANRTALSDRDQKASTRQVTGDPLVKFKLRNEDNNLCLRPQSGSTGVGVKIITSSCSNTASRRWYLWGRPGMSGQLLVNENSRLCAQRDPSGSGMIQMPCTGSTAQRFHFSSGGLFAGELVRQTTTQRCLRRLSSQSQTILSTSCANTASRRWYRDYL